MVLDSTKLKIARDASGKTQKQVANDVGITEVAYQNYEYGKRLPRMDVAQRLASALNTTVGELFPVGEVTDSA